MNWIQEMFGHDKAIIAMVHLKALPGDPGFDEEAGIEGVIDGARHDLLALQNGGVDGHRLHLHLFFGNNLIIPLSNPN